MKKKKIQIDQLETRIKRFSHAHELPNPPTGWIRAVRLALGISLQQLANKLNITKQGVQEIEMREKEGSITLRSLRETAKTLNMKLVYEFVPKDGTLEKYIDKKAHSLDEKIVLRTSNTMKLEDQENSNQRIRKAIEERTKII